MSSPWIEAGNKVKREQASWYPWARRRWGLLDPNDRAFWSRKQFKAALAVMPTDHPDRWAYKIGKRYAPNGDDLTSALAIFGTVAVVFGSIPLSVYTGVFFWAVAWPGLITAWVVWYWRKRRALST